MNEKQTWLTDKDCSASWYIFIPVEDEGNDPLTG